MRAQQGLGTLKRLFKQGEITAQLDSCERELKLTSDIFTVRVELMAVEAEANSTFYRCNTAPKLRVLLPISELIPRGAIRNSSN
jgi:hypothetical protein